MKLINKILKRFNKQVNVYCYGKHKDMNSLFVCKDCKQLFKGDK